MNTSDLRVTLKVLVHTALAVGLGYLLALFFIQRLDAARGYSEVWLRTRLSQSIAYVETAPHTDAARIGVFGASDIEVGIDPIAIDKSLQEQGISSETMNFGYRNMDPRLLHLLARRMCGALSARGEPLEIAAVQLSPARSSKTFASLASQSDAFRNFLEVEAAMYSSHMLAEDFFRKPDEVASVATVKYLFGGRAPNAAATHALDLIVDWMPVDRIPARVLVRHPELGQMERVRATWRQPAWLPSPPWDPATRGASFFNVQPGPHSSDWMHALYMDPRVSQWLLTYYQQQGDVAGLHFDPTLLDEEVATLLELEKCARRVVLLYVSDSPGIQRSPDAQERLSEALSTVASRAGVDTVRVGANGELQASDYLDYLHLNQGGRRKLSRLLGREFAKILARGRGPE